MEDRLAMDLVLEGVVYHHLVSVVLEVVSVVVVIVDHFKLNYRSISFPNE
jgi:hypothetical protein